MLKSSNARVFCVGGFSTFSIQPWSRGSHFQLFLIHFKNTMSPHSLDKSQPVFMIKNNELESKNKPEQSAFQKPNKSLHVLAVDDNARILNIVQLLLKSAGHRIVTATNGEDAVEAVRKGRRFDLILMDVQMPGMDGIETALRIKMIPEALGTPIVALTADVSANQVEACFAAGMVGHLGKPISPTKLLLIISQISQTNSSWPRSQDLNAASNSVAAIATLYLKHLSGFAPEIERLQALQHSQGAKAIAAYAHSIAGTAGSLGFRDVSDAAFQLEAVAKGCQGTGAAIENLAAQIRQLTMAIEDAQASRHERH